MTDEQPAQPRRIACPVFTGIIDVPEVIPEGFRCAVCAAELKPRPAGSDEPVEAVQPAQNRQHDKEMDSLGMKAAIEWPLWRTWAITVVLVAIATAWCALTYEHHTKNWWMTTGVLSTIALVWLWVSVVRTVRVMLVSHRSRRG